MCVSFWAYTRRRLGPIGTKFGTRMEIHLEMVMGEIKISPCDLGGIWGVLGVRKSKICNNYQTDGPIDLFRGACAVKGNVQVAGHVKPAPFSRRDVTLGDVDGSLFHIKI